MAAEHGKDAVVETLISKGADINKVTFHTEFTPLHFSVSKSHWSTAKILVEAGADLNAINQAGCYGSALHYAITKAEANFVKTLIAKGADVNLESGQGFTPLLLAASMDLVDICNLLLITGANVNDVDYEEKSALHYAAANGFGDLVKVLADAGADFKLKDAEGKSAFEVAEKCKEVEIADFLKKCENEGTIPSGAPKGKVKEQREFRTIEPIEGCGEGCAVPM